MRARKPSDLGRTRSSGRVGLAVLLATVAAFLLVPVAQAAAEVVVVNGAGSGSGEIRSESTNEFGGGNVACSWNGKTEEQTGTCTDTALNQEGYEILYAYPAEGSEAFVTWTINKGADLFEVFEMGFTCNTKSTQEEGIKEFGGPHCYVLPNEGGEVEVTVTFNLIPPPTLAVAIEEGEGSVVSNPAGIACPSDCDEAYAPETEVTLTASPAPGYLFKGWKKCDVGGVNGRQCKVKTTAELKTVGAKFVKAWNLEGTKSIPNGILSTSPGGINCGYGCNSSSALYKEVPVTVKTKPAKHFHFVKFQGGTGSATSCNGSEAETCVFTITEDSAIEEVYAEDEKNTLTLSKEGGGQALIKTKPPAINCGYTCSAAKGEFYFNETAIVSVKLNKGTTSIDWGAGAGTCTGKVETLESTCEVPMSASKSLVAKLS